MPSTPLRTAAPTMSLNTTPTPVRLHPQPLQLPHQATPTHMNRHHSQMQQTPMVTVPEHQTQPMNGLGAGSLDEFTNMI